MRSGGYAERDERPAYARITKFDASRRSAAMAHCHKVAIGASADGLGVCWVEVGVVPKYRPLGTSRMNHRSRVLQREESGTVAGEVFLCWCTWSTWSAVCSLMYPGSVAKKRGKSGYTCLEVALEFEVQSKR